VHEVPLRGHHTIQRCKSCESLGFRVGDRSRGRFATPADFPPHDGTPYLELNVRLGSLGFVHRSRAISCRAVLTIRNLFAIAVQRGRGGAESAWGGAAGLTTTTTTTTTAAAAVKQTAFRAPGLTQHPPAKDGEAAARSHLPCPPCA
jgi:hypothetical protein